MALRAWQGLLQARQGRCRLRLVLQEAAGVHAGNLKVALGEGQSNHEAMLLCDTRNVCHVTQMGMDRDRTDFEEVVSNFTSN